MHLNTLKPALGATKKRKRIGRGVGSGHGKTATKGHKGQKARSGGSIKAGFEGGQMPMQRRLPKRGFNPMNRIEFSEINVGRLNIFDANSIIDLDALVSTGLINKLKSGIKILGDGELTKPFTIKAHKFSCSAKEKIVAAGGTAEEITF